MQLTDLCNFDNSYLFSTEDWVSASPKMAGLVGCFQSALVSPPYSHPGRHVVRFYALLNLKELLQTSSCQINQGTLRGAVEPMPQ